jgi:transcriptional regulator with XRE-family HTH domain
MSERTSELPSIGERIRQLRVEQKPRMTQRELAERAGVSVDLISKLEQGTKQTALLVSLHKIARALDVDVSVLLAMPSCRRRRRRATWPMSRSPKPASAGTARPPTRCLRSSGRRRTGCAISRIRG